MRLLAVLSLFAFVAIDVLPQPAEAVPLFMGVGGLPGEPVSSQALGVSGDGSVVVGVAIDSTGESQAVQWSVASGLAPLGAGTAYAASTDGSVIVGESNFGSGTEAFRWTAESGLVGLGDLSGGGFESSARAVSGDGSVVGGRGDSGRMSTSPTGYTASHEAFRWDAQSGMEPLGILGPGTAYLEYWSSVTGISADGSVLAGFTTVTDNNVGFYWTEAGGMMPTTTCSYFCEYEIYGISADGKTIVGGVPHGSWGRDALYGTVEDDGSIMLYDLGEPLQQLVDTSGDGSIMVGRGDGPAIYFRGDDDPSPLQDYLALYIGADLAGWDLTEVTGISDDGLTFVGSGINPSGATEGWIATIPEPSTALLMSLGLAGLGIARRRA